MNKLVLLVFFALCGSSLYGQSFIEIKGKLNTENIKTVCLYRTISGRTDTIATSIPSADGTFGFLFKSSDSSYYSIGNKWTTHRLYLKPGDKASVAINDTIMTFVGPNTKENIALYQWEKISHRMEMMAIYFWKGGIFTYKEMFPELEAVNAKGKMFAKTVNTGNKSFDRLLVNTIAFDVDYYALLSIYTPRTEHPDKSMYPPTLTHIATSQLYDNDEVLKQPYGSNLLYSACMYRFMSAKEVPSDFDGRLNFIGGTQSKGELVITQASRLKTYKEVDDLQKKYGQFIITPDQKQRMNNIRLKLMVYTEGTPAYDFTYPDPTNKMVSLSDFKNKIVLVDVWATWCGPCKKEIPSMQALEEEFHGKDVVFISVSVDEQKDYAKWKSFIQEKQLGGVHLFAKGFSKIAEDYRINTIPRFMLFDKNGNIVTIDAPRPSNPDLKKIINEQLSK